MSHTNKELRRQVRSVLFKNRAFFFFEVFTSFASIVLQKQITRLLVFNPLARFFAMLLLSALLFVPLNVGWAQTHLTALSEAKPRFRELRTGFTKKRYWLAAVASVSIQCVCNLCYFVMNLFRHSQPAYAPLFALTLGVLLFYLALRFLFYTLFLADAPDGCALSCLKRSWQLTQGNVKRIVGMELCTFVPFFLLLVVLINLASFVQVIHPSYALYAFPQYAISFVFSLGVPYFAMCSAALYRELQAAAKT